MCIQCEKDDAKNSAASVSTEHENINTDKSSSSPLRKVIVQIPALRSFVNTTGLISKISAVTAFVLTLLCLFAGSSVGFLDQVDVMTLNTSMARSSLALSNVNASEMGVRDFYSIHVLSFCEGYDINSQRRAIRDVAYCSKRSATFEFDLSTALAADLHPGFNISDLTWPSTIADDFKFLSVTTKAVSTLYIIGAIATGMKVLMELFLLTTGGNRSSMLAHLVLTAFGFVTIGISSTLTSVIAMEFVGLINNHGSNFGITATTGSSFFGMSWSTVILLFISTIVGVATLPSSSSSSSEKEPL